MLRCVALYIRNLKAAEFQVPCFKSELYLGYYCKKYRVPFGSSEYGIKLQILIGIIPTFSENFILIVPSVGTDTASNVIRGHSQNVWGCKLRVLGQCDFMALEYC